jgi:hypothetical protein
MLDSKHNYTEAVNSRIIFPRHRHKQINRDIHIQAIQLSAHYFCLVLAYLTLLVQKLPTEELQEKPHPYFNSRSSIKSAIYKLGCYEIISADLAFKLMNALGLKED